MQYTEIQVTADAQLLDSIGGKLSGTSAERIFCVLGPNGVGKSRLLARLAEALNAASFKPAIDAAFLMNAKRYGVAGPREYLKHPERAGVKKFSISMGSVSSDFNFETEARQALAGLIVNAFNRSANDESVFQAASAAYLRNPSGEAPKPPQDNLKSISDFIRNAFGYETIIARDPGEHVPPRPNVTFRKDNVEFFVEDLSDGEQQILFLLALQINGSSKPFVFLVDEPELHLNEDRAESIWETFESRFPNAVFVYATHSTIFATRPQVDGVYFLASDGTARKGTRAEPVEQSIMQSMVGARVQILRTNKAPVFCEDEQAEMLLADLFFTDPVQIIRLHDWKEVEWAVRKEDALGSFRLGGKKVAGVVDLDRRNPANVTALDAAGVFCLPLNEAEAVLLHPEVFELTTVAASPTFTRDDYLNFLTEAARTKFHANVALAKADIEDQSRPTLSYDVAAVCQGDFSSIQVTTPASIKADFENWVLAYSRALSAQDVGQILKLAKGRPLYAEVRRLVKTARNIELGDAPQRYRELRANPKFRPRLLAIPEFAGLREKVLQRLG